MRKSLALWKSKGTFDAPWEIICTLTPFFRRTLKTCHHAHIVTDLKANTIASLRQFPPRETEADWSRPFLGSMKSVQHFQSVILLICSEEDEPQQFSRVLQPCDQVPIQSEKEKCSLIKSSEAIKHERKHNAATWSQYVQMSIMLFLKGWLMQGHGTDKFYVSC